MPATVTLATTTLAAPLERGAIEAKLASTSGVFVGNCLYVDGELMRVARMLIDPWVQVVRGIYGTGGLPHRSGLDVYVGTPDQFYMRDPVGTPDPAIAVSPWINVRTGAVWFARGDTLQGGNSERWWEKQVVTRSEGALGVRTTTNDPTSST